MKWLFLFTAIYVVLILKAPDHCDVKTLQQCTEDEIQIINSLKLKSDNELSLLLQMEKSECELIDHRYFESLTYIINEIKMMENKISLLNTLYLEETANYNEKIFDLKQEYRSDLTRRILALGREKSEGDQRELGT